MRITHREAIKSFTNLSLDGFPISDAIGFPLISMYLPAGDKNDVLLLRQYLVQFRQELLNRLIGRLYTVY
ncbi:unnamed protein product [Ambrosiozyma monospora]|uniref:Unnamed protein product n=1 Tax=Ambrosiozyma monospora TaxID=43982 RepID=A0A9W6YTG5_AMBMO|nr:unnamed protein product [Ambrosiozyma monospora]